MENTIVYYGVYYGDTMEILWRYYGAYYGAYYGDTIEQTIDYYGVDYGCTMEVLWKYYGAYYGVLWSAMESTIAYYEHTMGALSRIL